MASEGIGEVPVVVGGVIPKQDVGRLKEMGVKGVFPGGTSFDQIVTGIHAVAA
jgi:methylmalonyl-CoA mutase C-terminal domain/subunit